MYRRWFNTSTSVQTSDLSQVRAVWKDELRKYCDVIIFSVRGERSLASMLGGGDYDGGKITII